MVIVSPPRCVISAASSGSGKSVIACGIMTWLARRMLVQGFKVGPDYIDPMYHAQATQRAARNLDTWMLAPELVLCQYMRAAEGMGIAIIEGVMGLFDGYQGSSLSGSTAEVAQLLKAPIILVVDAAKMAGSVAALVHGFHTYHPDVRLAGVICNRVGSARHATWVHHAIEELGVSVLGCIPKMKGLNIPERHLGLFTAVERSEAVKEFLENASQVVDEYVDMDELFAIAQKATAFVWEGADELSDESTPIVNIALAQDEAFCFYYEDNLDELRLAGANILPFSPLRDAELPPNVQGIYLGGGYPELYVEQLSQNRSLLAEIIRLVKQGLPIYAECGGLMLLTQGIILENGSRYALTGIIPGWCCMSSHLTMGYREVRAEKDSLFLRKGDRLRGHEFHYSTWVDDTQQKAAYYIYPRTGEAGGVMEGFADGNVLASYIHLQFAQSRTIAQRFVHACYEINKQN